jgi:regulator of cell morphogenesis and NO signaling
VRNLGTIVTGVLLSAALLLGAWLYQKSSQDQGANRIDELTESQAATSVSGTSSKTWTVETTVGKIVADRPETARVLDLVGIDYCCGGHLPLQEAATAQNVDPAQLLNALLAVGASTTSGEYRDWQQAELSELIDHVVSTHHTWLRRELPTLSETTQTVLRVHGDTHSELAEVAATLERIRTAVFPHLDEEEQHLFPALRDLADGNASADIEEQLASMQTDHEALGADLHRLRELTNGFAEPADACAKYREMLTGLSALEGDMHQHVHLENNVLLPKVQSLLAELKAN